MIVIIIRNLLCKNACMMELHSQSNQSTADTRGKDRPQAQENISFSLHKPTLAMGPVINFSHCDNTSRPSEAEHRSLDVVVRYNSPRKRKFAMWMIRSLLLLVSPSLSHSLAGVAAAPSVRSVVIVGGTHGNEYTGVWCIKELEQPSVYQQVSKQYPSLQISTLMGNPDAHMANKRFIDTDLNREFTTKKLLAIQEKLASSHDQADTTTTTTTSILAESLRAQQVNQLLGPKTNPATDVVVDLHTTTTNMGITIIIPERDALMAQAAAYVMHKCQEENPAGTINGGSTTSTPNHNGMMSEAVRIVMHGIPDRDDRPNLSSVGKHGFTIEVGPVPQGVIRHDVVEKTKLALASFLEFLERHNKTGNDDQTEGSVLKEIKEWYPNGRVPCYRSAVAKKPGEMSGKIKWPCADHNHNFPKYMVHKSIQDQDFMLIKSGDPLFVSMEGDIIHYDGSHGDPVHLMFINEGGYYYASSGTGIGVAVQTEYELETADFVDLDELCLFDSDSEGCSLE